MRPDAVAADVALHGQLRGTALGCGGRARRDHSGERLTLRQARVLEVLALAGGPLSGEAIAARLGVRAGSPSVTLRSLQRRALIVAAASERARPGGWVLR
jgi:DNA-binding MarR family transcriptional regulator